MEGLPGKVGDKRSYEYLYKEITSRKQNIYNIISIMCNY